MIDEAKESKEEKKAEEEKHPFGEDITPAMYVLYDRKRDTFFLLAAPGFLDDPVRAYGALRISEKNLDEYYVSKRTVGERFTRGVTEFKNKMGMRNFLRGVK